MQDRLALERRLAGILSLKEANTFLSGFIKKFNARFSVVPREPQSAYRPLVVSIPNKAAITVLTSHRFGMRAEYNACVYQVRKAVRPAKIIPKEDRAKRPIKVKDDHPWKNSGVEPNFTYQESDRELVAGIYDPKGWE